MVKSCASNIELSHKGTKIQRRHKEIFFVFSVYSFVALCETPSRSLQQINKQRRSDQRGDGAHWQLPGRDERAGESVCHDHEHRATERGCGNTYAIIAPQ